MREPKLFIFVGLFLAVAGFLLIPNYFVHGSVVANVMIGKTLGTIPYRYVLLCSLALIGWGLYRYWIPGKK